MEFVTLNPSELAEAGIQSEQDWDEGSTTWFFEDGSTIKIEGSFVEVS